jgi:hypothetical protein
MIGFVFAWTSTTLATGSQQGKDVRNFVIRSTQIRSQPPITCFVRVYTHKICRVSVDLVPARNPSLAVFRHRSPIQST